MTETHRFSVSVAAAVVREDGKFLAMRVPDVRRKKLIEDLKVFGLP